MATLKRIALVRDLMHIGVPTCRADIPVGEAVRILLRDGFEALIVLDDQGHAVGLFGRREAVATYGQVAADLHNCATLTVAAVMQPEIPEVPPDIPATAATQIMLDLNIREIYLMHHDRGIRWPAAALRFEDILHHLAS